MSTEKLARCLGELQQLLPTVEDAALRQEVSEHVTLILNKMHHYCLSIAQEKMTKAQQVSSTQTRKGLNLADAAARQQ